VNGLEGWFTLGAEAGAAGSPSPLLVAFAICLSFALTLVIGGVYQLTHRGMLYSQDFVHTLVMLGTLVTVVIMGIGQNLAAAFGIFAAFSIIRFRRALPEARDVGFVFFAMAVGLACGSGEFMLATMTTVLVSAAVFFLARTNLFAPERPSHLMRARVTNDIDYDAAFAEPLSELVDSATLLSVESVQAGMMTEVAYAVRLAPGASPGELVAAIQARNGNNRVIVTTADPGFGGG